MIMKEEHGFRKNTSFHFKKMFEIPGRLAHGSLSEINYGDGYEERPCKSPGPRSPPIQNLGNFYDFSRLSNYNPPPVPITPKERPTSDLELMKERFAKLLLGEDMSGGGKGVSSALALSNAITNLAASVFGEQKKLEPMGVERKARWKKEIDWLLSVTDHIVELIPSQQKSQDGTNMEIMVTQQRKDLLENIPALRKLDAMLIDCLDNFNEGSSEFWYVSRDADEAEQGSQRDDKWWLPTVKICPEGLSESTQKWLHHQKDCVNQVLKASMAINAQTISEMDIPEDYIDSLPKNGRSSLGDNIYKNITVEFFDPSEFLLNMDLSSEHKVLDLKNRIEASIVIWKRKMNHKDGKSSWGSAISLEKRELFEERAETILLLLKIKFPGLPQSSLDISKIQFNKDVGHAVLESYSRVLESLAYNVMSRVEDVLYSDSLLQDPSLENKRKPSGTVEETNYKVETPTSMTLSDFMGWNPNQQDSAMKENSSTSNVEYENDNSNRSPDGHTSKITSYMEKIAHLSALRSPTRF